MMKNTHAIRKTMPAAKPRRSWFFMLEAIKKPAQIIKRIQPHTWNFTSRFLALFGISSTLQEEIRKPPF